MVAKNVVERVDSRTVTRSGGTLRRRRVWVVTGTPAGSSPFGSVSGGFDENAAIHLVGVKVGDVHPSDPTMRAVEFTSEPEEGQRFVYRVTWQYGFIPSGISPSQQDEESLTWLQIDTDTRREFVDTWRRDGAVTDKDNPDINTDIGGQSMDIGGEPISVGVATTELKITHNVDFPVQASLYASLANTRNDGEWLGAEAGRLVYVGAQTQRLNIGRARVTHTFVWDEWYHMRQRARIILDGDEKGEIELFTIPQLYAGSAAHVFWVQPYHRTANFAALGIPF